MGNITDKTIEPNASLGTTAATYSADRTPDGSAIWVDRSADAYIGFGKATLSLVRPKGPRGAITRNLRVAFKLETPVMAVPAGPNVNGLAPSPTVDHRPFTELNVQVSDRSTDEQRAKHLAHLRAWVNSSEFADAVLSFQIPR